MTNVIMGGTNNYPLLRNVLGALTSENGLSLNPSNLDAIWLIDTSETSDGLSEISKEIKKILGRRDIVVSSLEVNENDAADRIPEFMAQFVLCNTKQKTDLIIDLTTGPKYITSLLYATANFCRVNEIYYFLLKDSNKRIIPFSQLKSEDYEYIRLPPFSGKSLTELSRRSHLDLIYYLKDVDELTEEFFSKSIQLGDELDRNMRLAVRDYFSDTENYEGVIRSVSSLLEAWSDRLYEIWDSQGMIEANPPLTNRYNQKNTWAYKLERMSGVFNALRKARDNEIVKGFTPEQQAESLPLAYVGDLLEMVRVYRNMAVHKADHSYQISRDDAKLVLDTGFAFIRKCKRAAFLLKYGWE